MRAVAHRPNAWTPLDGGGYNGQFSQEKARLIVCRVKKKTEGISQWADFQSQCVARKIGRCTNEADGSAYEGVEVATGSVDVRLGPGATVLLGQTAEQDGLSNHYLEAQRYNIQFTVVTIEGKGGGEGSLQEKNPQNLTPTIFCMQCFVIFAWQLRALRDDVEAITTRCQNSDFLKTTWALRCI